MFDPRQILCGSVCVLLKVMHDFTQIEIRISSLPVLFVSSFLQVDTVCNSLNFLSLVVSLSVFLAGMASDWMAMVMAIIDDSE